MPESPSTHGRDGRDRQGRFARGNREGRGNPLAGRAAKLRAIALEAVTFEDMRTVIKKLVALAKEGDVAAARELLNRVLGPPVELDLLDRLETIETRLADREAMQ